MAVRKPLKLDGTNLKEMSVSEIADIQTEVIRLYGENPSVTLSVVASGGSLGTLSDTRLQAGAGTTDVTDFDTEVETPDVSTVTVNYSKINQTVASTSVWTNATYSYPLYYDGTNLREMTVQDFYDTFINDALPSLISGSTGTAQAGTYFISTSSSVAGSTEVSGSATPIFTDTRADAAAYTAAGIPETQDQPTTITNYYLHRINSAAAGSLVVPVTYTKSGIDLYRTPISIFRTALQDMIRHKATQAGSQISYNINGAGNNRGTAMTDTKLDASTYLQLYVNTDDYRTQEVPSGTSTNISTYYLRITQV